MKSYQTHLLDLYELKHFRQKSQAKTMKSKQVQNVTQTTTIYFLHPPSISSKSHSNTPRPSNHTPILRPGLKKAYTPRPSHSHFPETPTPSSNHSILVQGWKDRFTSKFTNTISSRPMTPLHTPIFRRKTVTPTSSGSSLGRHVSSKLAVEEIEEVSPPRGRMISLDQFRFTPQ